MDNEQIDIAAPGMNTEALVAEIRATVARKQADGVYSDARVARAERTNLGAMRNEEQFLGFYLKCLRDAVFVDISDFDIRERRRGIGLLLVSFKRLIWNLLKFYTYRLWSQQNEVNGLLVTAIEGIDHNMTDRVAALEKRLAKLEGKKPSSEESNAS